MLNLSLLEISRGEARVEGVIPPDDALWEGAELELVGPLQMSGAAQSVGDGVLVRGEMRARVRAECRRCLESVEVSIEAPVTLLFEPLEGEGDEALDGEVYPLPKRGDGLDLGPALREELLLRVPHFVVCEESCRGLCPTCGANLNETSCECAVAVESSPWDALKNLKSD